MQEKHYIRGTSELIDLMKSHKKPYNIKLLGKEWIVLPGVFSPKYTQDAEFFSGWLSDLKGKSFLEIGSGTGIISIKAAFMKAKKVVAIDVSKNAVKNTKLNAKNHKIRIDVRCGYLFDPVSKNEKFDVIFFNAPFGFREKPVKGILEKSVWDYKYFTLKDFLRYAKNYLSENGKILLGFSSIGHISFLKHEARKCKYSIKEVRNKKGKQGKVTEGLQIYKMYELGKR